MPLPRTRLVSNLADSDSTEQDMREHAQLYLASASPRRRKILEQLGVSFTVHVTDVEEVDFERDPDKTVRTNALHKLNATRAVHASGGIIAADTVLEFDGRCIGKPEDMGTARALLRELSGRMHHVLTGVALAPGPKGASHVVTVCRTAVQFRELGEDNIDAYFREVNPLDKAGAYNIDQSGEMIIESIDGSRTNVMGLPVEIVKPWLIEQRFL